ncbi:MAG: SHOCT domain-containing protein [Actinomycetota bacterium]
MLRRRRPVLRAATVAGGAALAYHAGKSVQGGRDQDAAQDEHIAQMQQQPQQVAPAAPAAGGMSPDAMTKLQQLGQLHEQGVLTDEEFAEQKKKVLG